MKNHNIYVEEGDTITIRPVNGDLFDVNARGWKAQMRPHGYTFTITGNDHITFSCHSLCRPTISIDGQLVALC